MTKTLICRPRVAGAKEDLGSELGLRLGSLVAVKQPWLIYSAQVGGRRLELFRPAIDHYSPQPGEPARVTRIEEGSRHENQYHVTSLFSRKRNDWFFEGDLEIIEP